MPLITVGGNAALLRFLAFLWKAIPFRTRRGVTFLFIKTVLWEKKLLKTDEQTALTAIKDLGSLAYWGFPKVDLNTFSLTVDGAMDKPPVPSLAGPAGITPGQPAGADGLRRRVPQQHRDDRGVGIQTAGYGKRQHDERGRIAIVWVPIASGHAAQARLPMGQMGEPTGGGHRRPKGLLGETRSLRPWGRGVCLVGAK